MSIELLCEYTESECFCSQEDFGGNSKFYEEAQSGYLSGADQIKHLSNFLTADSLRIYKLRVKGYSFSELCRVFGFQSKNAVAVRMSKLEVELKALVRFSREYGDPVFPQKRYTILLHYIRNRDIAKTMVKYGYEDKASAILAILRLDSPIVTFLLNEDCN